MSDDPSTQFLLSFQNCGPNDHLYDGGTGAGGGAQHASGTPPFNDEQDEQSSATGDDTTSPLDTESPLHLGAPTAISEMCRLLKKRKTFSAESEADLDKFAQVSTFSPLSLLSECSTLVADTLGRVPFDPYLCSYSRSTGPCQEV